MIVEEENMKYIRSFIKFTIIAVVLITISDYTTYRGEFSSFIVRMYLGHIIGLLILIFVTFKKNYIAFKKGDWKLNLLNSIIGLCYIVWLLIIRYYTFLMQYPIILAIYYD